MAESQLLYAPIENIPNCLVPYFAYFISLLPALNQTKNGTIASGHCCEQILTKENWICEPEHVLAIAFRLKLTIVREEVTSTDIN